MDIWTRLNDFVAGKLWGVELGALGRTRAAVVKFLRLLYVAVREFFEGQVNLRAMSLVYTTLLSLVPLLAVSFSVLKAFGVHNQVAPFLTRFLSPLGPRGAEIAERVIGFVNNMKVGVLGSLGLAFLIYTVISLIQKVEDAFNYIWKIKRPRSFARRFSDYMSVILVGPVLIFSALGITASVLSTSVVQRVLAIEPFGTLVYTTGKILPYVLVIMAFTFIYVFVPSVKVRFRAALVGGIFAGVIWETVGWAFASFIVTSTRYAAIYSGFAILVLFMIWLYLSWLILLVGAEVSFYYQYPQFIAIKKESLVLSGRQRERLALTVMYLAGYNHCHDARPWTLDGLTSRLSLPVEPVQDVILVLEQKGLLAESADEPPAYLPARALETIRLKDIVDAVRSAEESSYRLDEKHLSAPEVDKVVERMEASVKDALGGMTIRDLVVTCTGEKEA
ncbi:MAG: YihY/virulence factor BrkB family protein [Thermodesulfovibrionales bacterium]